jgi:hypothetical protein
VKVPRPVKACFGEVRGDLSLFIHFNPLRMRTSDGQNVDSNVHSVSTTVDARHASNVNVSITRSQAEFLNLVQGQGYLELSKSLKLVHDLALYHSDISFNGSEKSALFDLKLLWEGIERMDENA